MKISSDNPVNSKILQILILTTIHRDSSPQLL